MNILLVAGANPLNKNGNPIFLDLAIKTKNKLNKHKVSIAVDTWNDDLVSFTNNRKKNDKLFNFLSKYLMRAYELVFLQRKYRNISKGRYENLNKFVNFSGGINSSKFKEYILEENFDLIICFAVSIVQKNTLEVGKYKFINLHPGILPEYKGIGNFWAVLNKDYENIGITIHWMNEKIDDGKIISIQKLQTKFSSLWQMNINSFEIGIEELERLINKENIYEIQTISNSISKYYGWYGIFEYFKFKKSVKELHLEI